MGIWCIYRHLKQWRNYTTTVKINQTIIETLPITVTKNFAAILSDTDSNIGSSGDFSGGSTVKKIDSNTITWVYNWNSSNEIMINIIVIGII